MTLLELWNDFKAWRRGEHRIAPYGTQGRVYSKKIPLTIDNIPSLLASGKFKGSIAPTGLWRASEGRWYDINEDGSLTPREEGKGHGDSTYNSWARRSR